MAINPIQNGELGSSVRSKLNQAIQEANKVSGKQDSAALGSAAFESVDAFDPAGSAQEAEDFAVQRENHTGEQGISTVSGLRDALDRRVIYVDTVADLQALDTSGLVEGQQVSVNNVGMFTFFGGGFFPQSTNVQSGEDFPEDPSENQLFIIPPDALYYYNGSEWQLLISDDVLQEKINQAESAADRAETARDAAFINADVYDDVAAGLAATSDGDQFQVAVGLEVVRYLNDDGSAVEVARYPAAEFVKIALDVASQPGPVSGEFYADDSEQPVYSITDGDGRALASWDNGGFQEIQLRADFHTEDNQPYLAWTDSNNIVFYGIDERGHNVVGGGEGLSLSSAPEIERDTDTGSAFIESNFVKRRPVYPDFYSLPTTVFETHEDVYFYFDELLDEYPDYVEKKLLGNDALGNPLYIYELTPPGFLFLTGWDEEDIELPEAVIISGLHGGAERTGVFPAVVFAQELCRNWFSEIDYQDWRWNCRFVFIPAANPSGFDLGTRKNHNEVDLNRNFPINWAEGGSSDPESNSYRGPSEASEAETQLLMTVPDLYPNAFAFYDLHSRGTIESGGYASWVGVDSRYGLRVAEICMRDAHGFLKKEFPFIEKDNAPYSRITKNPDGAMNKYFSVVKEKNAWLFESVNGIGGTRTDTIRYNVWLYRLFFGKFFELYQLEDILSASKTAED